MESTKDEFEELVKDPDRLCEHLGDHISEMSQTLNDDEDFCNKDIDATLKYMKIMETKIFEKFQELKNQLEQIRKENQKTSEENKKKFDNETQDINTLFTAKNYHEAWKKFKDYEKNFLQRTTVIRRIPKLHMHDKDIERYFFSDDQPTTSDPLSPTQSTTITADEIQDPIDDDVPMTSKERRRQNKTIEAVHIDKDNEEITTETTVQTIDNSKFGARSRQTQNQATAANGITPSISSTPKYCFSTRLGANSNKTNLPFSGRNVSATQNNTHPIPEPKQLTLTSSNSLVPISQRQPINLNLNPVSHYQHDRNKTLLMACNYNYIVLFKSQRNRLDHWELGAIERRTQSEHNLIWHDGLIISMGCMAGNDQIYMFTEREFSIYSISQRRRLDSRILPRGSDDGLEVTTEYQRGIGTVHDKYWYHIYLNRSSHWTLSKNTLERLAHISDSDLTRMFPDVTRFIHFCVDDKTIHFLVQMNDLSYAVITDHTLVPVILIGAQQPLTIYSAYHQTLKEYLCFINDPSSNILHITTTQRCYRCSLTAYGIYYLAEKTELMIVTNNSIGSININRQNFVF